MGEKRVHWICVAVPSVRYCLLELAHMATPIFKDADPSLLELQMNHCRCLEQCFHHTKTTMVHF